MTQAMKKPFWNMLASGLDSDYELESLRKISLVNILTILGIVFLVPFSVLAVFQKNLPLAAADLISVSRNSYRDVYE